ncbi:hypothetical protein [Streptomyces poriferorum]|uniref:Uncharacterized protein n=1 Tax=Streptomyces poriferorum TaxID=2798799 RepID=A0ABY9J477_9ACTN|nr:MULTISPECIES: hypothetical protein [unclassified Streptomyces]MDP5310097.1 hypothetical protein [Streptomyces sp. Alt4]WLQ60736.1 hypothetical protein P8A19_37270 [Streptomyces sp. Alt2]
MGLTRAERAACTGVVPGCAALEAGRGAEASVQAWRWSGRVVGTARQGVGVLGPGPGGRIEGVARFLDFVNEGTTRAAEQAREALCAKPGTAPGDSVEPDADRT